MKKIRISLLATLIATAFVMPLQAQYDGDLHAYNSLRYRFQQAFNKEDTAALQRVFSANSVFSLYHDTPLVGAKAIGNFWAAEFKNYDVRLELLGGKITWSQADNGNMGQGRYRMTRRDGKGDSTITSGSYTIVVTFPKGDNVWKISKLTLERCLRTPIRTVNLSGSGYALGLQHGQLLKKEIGQLVATWKATVESSMYTKADTVVQHFFEYARFDESIKQWTPELYEEVRGIADGSGQSFHDIMVQSLLDEFWVWQDAKKHHCSGIGVPARNGNPAYIAQNMDLEGYTDGHQVLLHIAWTDTRPEQYILTYPGCIALNGLNEAGVGACMNTLMQLKAAPTGLPVAFVVRGILNRTKRDEVLQFIQNVPHASGQNYILGIRDEVFDFEASANKVARFDPQNANSTVYHTNHPLANDDLKDWFKDPEMGNSSIRLASVQGRIQNLPVVKEEDLKAALRAKDDPDNPVCQAFDQRGGTFASVMMTLTGNPKMQITAGPPDESEYHSMGFSSQKYQTREYGWRSITGYIMNEINEPLIGATMLDNVHYQGGVNNFDGRYTMKVPLSTKALSYQYDGGYVDQTIPLTASDTMNVVLLPGHVDSLSYQYRVKRTQSSEVSGVIKGKTSSAIRPRVRVEGTNITALADQSGSYRIMVPAEHDVLVFESDNHVQQRILIGNFKTLNVSILMWTKEEVELLKKEVARWRKKLGKK